MKFLVHSLICIFLFFGFNSKAQVNNEIYDVSQQRLARMTNDQLVQWYDYYYKLADANTGATRDYWEMLGYTVENEYYQRMNEVNRTHDSQNNYNYYVDEELDPYYNQEDLRVMNPRLGRSNRQFSHSNTEGDNSVVNPLYGELFLSYKGNSFELYFEEPGKNFEYLASLFYNNNFSEVLADMDRIFQLEKPIGIVFTQGKPGPLYYNGIIHLTYEFFHSMNILAYNEMEKDPEKRAFLLLDLAEFILYHEIGHALIHQLDIPVLGKEEDAVDQFAAIISSQLDLEDTAITAAEFFDLQSSMKETKIKSFEFWDSHSLDEQRMYSIICLIYGNEPDVYEDLAKDYEFNDTKREDCKYDFFRANRSWGRLLGDAIRK